MEKNAFLAGRFSSDTPYKDPRSQRSSFCITVLVVLKIPKFDINVDFIDSFGLSSTRGWVSVIVVTPEIIEVDEGVRVAMTEGDAICSIEESMKEDGTSSGLATEVDATSLELKNSEIFDSEFDNTPAD